MQKNTGKRSPCLTCQRVRDPKNCENKMCEEWRRWWIGRWDAIREGVAKQAKGAGVQGHPVSVGGTQYHHPERVREFLKMDPCLRCPWRDGLCPNPCDTRKVWLEAKERGNELESGSKG